MLGQVFTVFGNETRCVSCFQIGRGLAIVCGFLFEGQPPIKLMHVSSCRSLWFCVEYLDMYQNSLGRCSMVLFLKSVEQICSVFVKYLMIVLYVKVVVVCVYDSPTCEQRMVAVRVTRSSLVRLVWFPVYMDLGT